PFTTVPGPPPYVYQLPAPAAKSPPGTNSWSSAALAVRATMPVAVRATAIDPARTGSRQRRAMRFMWFLSRHSDGERAPTARGVGGPLIRRLALPRASDAGRCMEEATRGSAPTDRPTVQNAARVDTTCQPLPM